MNYFNNINSHYQNLLIVYSQVVKRGKAIKKKDDEKRLKLETKIIEQYSSKLNFIDLY